MDAGDMTAAMGGFFMGQMFAGQTQGKPALMHFVALRVDRDQDILNALNDVMLEAFLNLPADTKLKLEFTNKAELKVWGPQKMIAEKPLFVVGLCSMVATKKDIILCLGLRNEVGAPFPLNIALLRHLLISLDAKKVKYELW